MKTAIYSGSFDPVTVGHMQIIEKGIKLFDKVIVAVMKNSAKSTMFSVADRLEFLKAATAHLPTVEVASFDGLQAVFAKERGATHFLRGLRSADDFSVEYTIALVNKSQQPELETVFISPDAQYSYVCSAAARDILFYGGDASALVPKEVLTKIYKMNRGGLTDGKFKY